MVLCVQFADHDLRWIRGLWYQLRRCEICDVENILHRNWRFDYGRWIAGGYFPAGFSGQSENVQ